MTVLVNKDHVEFVLTRGNQHHRLPLEVLDSGGHRHAGPVGLVPRPRPPGGPSLLNEPSHRAASYRRRSSLADINVAQTLVSRKQK